jgi:large-conductance mechanosensitive channel
MESYGKIWVVIVVILIIQTAVFLYMLMLDKRISKIEKQHKDTKIDNSNKKI